jgi:hypothetical protein
MQMQFEALRDLVEKRKALTGGRWVTISGAHVYIRRGKIVAGPSGVRKSAKAKGGRASDDDDAGSANSSAPDDDEGEEKGPTKKVKLDLLSRLLDILKKAFQFDAPDRELDTKEVEPKSKDKPAPKDDEPDDEPDDDDGPEDDDEPEDDEPTPKGKPTKKSKPAKLSPSVADKLDPSKLKDMSPDQLRGLAKTFRKEAERIKKSRGGKAPSVLDKLRKWVQKQRKK